MIILGIDPGSRITGFGVVELIGNRHRYLTSGCIKANSPHLSERLLHILQGISSIITTYAPREVAIEKIFAKLNVSSAFKLGMARGAAFIAAASHNLPIAEYAPRQIKKTVVGYGGADKCQIQHMVKLLLSLSDVPQVDAADALAIALCHANHRRGGINSD